MMYSAMRMRTPLVKAFGRFRAAAAVGAPKSAAAFTNITYSGGHASEGQGGYYGSGGARHIKVSSNDDRPTIAAMVDDIHQISHFMKELETLEQILQRELEESRGEVTGKSIEINSSIKKLMTSNEVMEVMNRLEHDGEPTWGLTESEIGLVRDARSKINEC